MQTLKDLSKNIEYQNHKNINQKLDNLESLLTAVKKKDLTESVVTLINKHITDLNTFTGTPKNYLKQIRKTQYQILQTLEKELNIIPKGHYRNKWFTVGMTTFGLSFGVVFSVLIDNFAFVGIGLPIGMAIGMAIGTNKDKKAKNEGRQLDTNIKW